jgi:hypothetical protein
MLYLLLGNHRIRTSNGSDNEHQGKIIYNLEIAKKRYKFVLHVTYHNA